MSYLIKRNKLLTFLANRLYRIFQQDFNALRLRVGQQSILSSRLLRGSYKKLSDSEVTVFSQWGEDGILDYLCDIASLDRPTILELGAGNFEECNSRFLVENRLANSVLVDARPDLISFATQSGVYWKTHMLVINSWITPITIKDIQKKAVEFLERIDILSIDIDGNDFWVLSEFDFAETTIVVVEYNPIFGTSIPVTIPREDNFSREQAHFSNLYYGVSLAAWVSLLQKRGFVLAGTNLVGSNAFFIRAKLIEKLHFVPSVDLNSYVNWGVRESRSRDGKLSFLSGAKRKDAIAHLNLVNVESGESLTVGSLPDLNQNQ